MKLLRLLFRTLRDGGKTLHPDARREIVGFLRSQQGPAGGSTGPDRSGEDLYYTLFNVSAQAALGGWHRLLTARRFLRRLAPAELDLPHAAALAILRRMALLSKPGIVPAEFAAPDGGFSHLPGAAHGSAYGAYLAMLLCEALGRPFPGAAASPEPVRKGVWRTSHAQVPGIGDESDPFCACDTPLVGSDNRPTGACGAVCRRSVIRTDQSDIASRRKVETFPYGVSLDALATADGALANQPGQARGLTTATAAGIMLAVHGNIPLAIPPLRRWLLDQARPDGGFAASPGGLPDLLSTASALTALRASGQIPGDIRVAQARFIQACWTDEGGFRAAPDHGIADAEYTCYAILGMGCLR